MLKRVEAESKTKHGIVLPETAKEKPSVGRRWRSGTGRCWTRDAAKFQVKKGDEVIFASYAGTEVKIEDVEYLILSEDEVLAVID